MAAANSHCCIGFRRNNQRSIQKKCRLIKKFVSVVDDLEDAVHSQLATHCNQIATNSDSGDNKIYPVQFYDSDDAYLLKCRPMTFDNDPNNDDEIRTLFGIREAAMSAALTSEALDQDGIPAVNVSWFEPEFVDDDMNQYSCSCEHPRGSWKRQGCDKLDSNNSHDQIEIESSQCEGNDVRIIDLTKLQDMRKKNTEAAYHPSFNSSEKTLHLLRSLLNCNEDHQSGGLHCASPWKTSYRESVEESNLNTRHDNPRQMASTRDQIVALLIKHPSSADDLETQEYRELFDFRVGDAAPSYYLYSTLQLGSRDDFYEALHQSGVNRERIDFTDSLGSSTVSLFVYRKLEPRGMLNSPSDEEHVYPGCLVETFLDQPAESDDSDLDSRTEPVLSRRLVSPPYLNHDEDFAGLLDPLLRRIDDVRREAQLIPQWTAWPERNHYSSGDNDSGASWTVFPLCYTFPANDVTHRQFIDKTCAFVPATTALLQGIGPSLRTALFSRLEPNTKLGTHTGWSDLANHVIRIHVPLVVPQNDVCGTWVDGCVETQDVGRIICFDDSKVHRAYNYSESEERVVLIIDLERPTNLPQGTATGGHTDELDEFIKLLSK